MRTPAVEAYWARRAAQFKTIEAAYTQKEMNMSLSIEVDKAVMPTEEKRGEDVVEEKCQKEKKKVNSDKNKLISCQFTLFSA